MAEFERLKKVNAESVGGNRGKPGVERPNKPRSTGEDS